MSRTTQWIVDYRLPGSERHLLPALMDAMRDTRFPAGVSALLTQSDIQTGDIQIFLWELPKTRGVAMTEAHCRKMLSDIGAFDDPEVYANACRIVVERKTYGDLFQSLLDGRFKTQKVRLLNCGAPAVRYLVEGPFPTSPDDQKRLFTITESFLQHKNCAVVQSPSLEYSARYLMTAGLHQVHDQDLTLSPELHDMRELLAGETQTIESQFKDLTRDDMRRRNMLLPLTLGFVPNIGTERAMYLSEHHKQTMVPLLSHAMLGETPDSETIERGMRALSTSTTLSSSRVMGQKQAEKTMQWLTRDPAVITGSKRCRDVNEDLLLSWT